MPFKQQKRICMVIALVDYRDEEYFIPKSVFEQAGFKVKTASERQGQAISVFGGVADIDLKVSEAKTGDFDGLVVVGGEGMAKMTDNAELRKLAQEFAEQNKIVGAICIGPAVLAKAGILTGKKATIYASQTDKSAVKILQENNAQYLDEPVVVDGNIITASGPQSARKFAEKVVEAMGAGG
ncbi:MAG: DJ-1/PfpI family protein [Patescibacteria group bacterium]|nr:DJ-1/PfpI family protein [Patescibacteria group bacterium]